jgi:hypothetical protein
MRERDAGLKEAIWSEEGGKTHEVPGFLLHQSSTLPDSSAGPEQCDTSVSRDQKSQIRKMKDGPE